jgi:DNA topoisomerase VI subunit B
VFCSLVSTKIPFKGAGKEYIGDDIEEMVSEGMSECVSECSVE